MQNLWKQSIRWWWLLLLIGVGIAAFAWYTSTRANAKGENPYTLERQTLQEELIFSGSIEADEQAQLHFQTGGLLTQLNIAEGDTVSAGQTIATLDQRQVRKTLEKYLNTYSKERLDFDNEKQVREGQALPMNVYDRQNLIDSFKKAQFDLSNSVLDVELQDVSIQYSTLTSPIDGLVTHMDTQVAGVNVTALTTFEIVNPDTMYFAAAADQTEVVKLKTGMIGEVVFDAYPQEDYTSSITALGYTPKEDETGTVYEVKLGVAGSGIGRYRLGMTGDVAFVTQEIKDALAVPITYVKTEDEKRYVWRQVGSKYEKTYIEEGELFDALVMIKSGLSEGDVIVEQ